MGHTIRILLELNPTFVVAATDMENTFNSMYRHEIKDAVNFNLPEIYQYVKWT